METNITFNLDGTCERCARGLDKYNKLMKRNEKAYGSKNLKTGKLVGKVELVPDYNSNGILTHWHIR